MTAVRPAPPARYDLPRSTLCVISRCVRAAQRTARLRIGGTEVDVPVCVRHAPR